MEDDHIPDRAEILGKAANGTLVDAMFDEYGRIWLDDESPTITLLAEMHNAGEIDLLAIVTPEAVGRHQGPGFFEGQHLYEKLIPKLSGSVRDMVRAVEALRVGGGNDLAAGLHIDKFANWCGADSTRPLDLLKLIDEGEPDVDGYLIIAIKTGVRVDRPLFVGRAYDFLENGTERQRLNALNALGQIEIPDAIEWDRLIAALNAAQTAQNDDAFSSQMLSTAAQRLETAPVNRVPELEAVAEAALSGGGDQTLHTAARILAFDTAPLSDALHEKMLEALQNVASANDGTIDLLDIGLSKLAKSEKLSRVRAFIRSLLLRDSGAIRLSKLDSTVRAVIEDPSEGLADWVVAWLRDGDYRLCSAMDRAMFGAGRDGSALTVDFSRYGLRDAEYPFLARKVVASFFLKPLLMASMLASLLRTVPASVADEVEQILIDPVLQNYTGAAREHLLAIGADASDPAAPAALRAVSAQDEYLDGLKAPGRVPELHPSEREKQLEWERHSDSMIDAMREARKSSIIAQIAKESVMLHGKRAISWVDTPGEEPRRIETQLGSIGTSFEVPRVDIVDPIGLHMMLLSFRMEAPPL